MKFNIQKSLKKTLTKSNKLDAVASIPELAVVLIIMGLLVTSFATFSKIIGVAKSNSIISSINLIKQSSFTFKNSYQFLPGDIVNASTVLDSTQKNGNGNGLISWGSSASGQTNESLLFYQHLKSTGSIGDIVAYTVNSTTSASVTSANILKSNVDGAGFIPLAFNSTNISSFGFDNTKVRGGSFTIVFGMIGVSSIFDQTTLAGGDDFVASTGGGISGGAVDASVLKSIDKKMDDNNPLTGSFKFNENDPLPVAGYNVDLM